tara:strand:- start:1132 stop:1467 length:336 start_codon:yes stop_codon:yes gene_type:complete
MKKKVWFEKMMTDVEEWKYKDIRYKYLKKYVKIYMDYHDYVIDDIILCTHCGKQACDIHHIDARGLGSSKKKDYIENLIALCRACHIKAETDKQFNNQLRELNKHKHNHKY